MGKAKALAEIKFTEQFPWMKLDKAGNNRKNVVAMGSGYSLPDDVENVFIFGDKNGQYVSDLTREEYDVLKGIVLKSKFVCNEL